MLIASIGGGSESSHIIRVKRKSGDGKFGSFGKLHPEYFYAPEEVMTASLSQSGNRQIFQTKIAKIKRSTLFVLPCHCIAHSLSKAVGEACYYRIAQYRAVSSKLLNKPSASGIVSKMPIHYDTKRPWAIMLQMKGSVWKSVLPYCVFNCCLTYLIYFLETKLGIRITFSGQAHALMSLIVSYLVVSKVYLSLERYMISRTVAGQALTTLRELNQLVLTFSEGQSAVEARIWRREAREKIVVLLHSTIRVIRDEEKASYLARNEPPATDDDPFLFALTLRSHLYHGCYVLPVDLHVLERTKMVDQLNTYLSAYRDLLKLASTPLPFTMIQMGRTFLFLWTFTMPFALVGIVDEIISVIIFVFFLTFGYIGLEFVSMKLLHPFGDSSNDINIIGMGDATIVGIEKDSVEIEALCQKEGELLKRRLGTRKVNAHAVGEQEGYDVLPTHDSSGPIDSGEDGADYYAFP